MHSAINIKKIKNAKFNISKVYWNFNCQHLFWWRWVAIGTGPQVIKRLQSRYVQRFRVGCSPPLHRNGSPGVPAGSCGWATESEREGRGGGMVMQAQRGVGEEGKSQSGRGKEAGSWSAWASAWRPVTLQTGARSRGTSGRSAGGTGDRPRGWLGCNKVAGAPRS